MVNWNIKGWCSRCRAFRLIERCKRKQSKTQPQLLCYDCNTILRLKPRGGKNRLIRKMEVARY